MPRKNTLTHCTNKIVVSSSSNDSDDHESLSAHQEQATKTHVSTHEADSSSVILPCRGEVSSQQDPFTWKYQAPEFEVILDRWVNDRTTHLAANYERLNAETTTPPIAIGEKITDAWYMCSLLFTSRSKQILVSSFFSSTLL